ncbi:MAG: hypothetical protein ACRENP_23585 [Longimicrobiales bacterium]
MRFMLLASALLSTVSPSLALAQTNTQDETGPIVLRVPASARALALGGVYPGLAPDPDAIYYNPALLQSATGLSLAAQMWGSASRLYTFAGTNGAGFGFGVQFLDYEVAALTPAGNIGSPFGLSRDGGRASGELNATIGYARTFFGRLRLGIAAKAARHLGADQSAGIAALDIGTWMNPFNWLNVSLAAQNLGGSLVFNGAEYDLPMRAVLNAFTRSRTIGPLDLAVGARVSAGPDEDVGAGLGVEVGYWPFAGLNFYARAGVKLGTGEYNVGGLADPIEEVPFTAGGGVSWGRLSLDYALEPYSGAAHAHRIGLRVR